MTPSPVPREVFRHPGFSRPLPRQFFEHGTIEVARDLLGKILIHRTPHGDRAGQLVEVEAYVAHDPASHAFRGLTRRNRSMFGPPGTLYVYRIHRVVCANAVTQPGEAVLFRAAAPVSPGLAAANGPGRLTRALGIVAEHDGIDLIGSPVRLLPGPVPAQPIAAARRVGVRNAPQRKLRFLLVGNPSVSRKPGREGNLT